MRNAELNVNAQCAMRNAQLYAKPLGVVGFVKMG